MKAAPSSNPVSETPPAASNSNGFSRRDVAFNGDGIHLRGWLYEPSGDEGLGRDGSRGIIVMCGGFGTTKEMFNDLFAERFAQAGFMVLLYDHRGFGASDGMPRGEINPWQQIEDFRHAITYAGTLPGVDKQRLGIWGSSYSGGHAIVVAATDRRVKCVVVQVPTTSGSQSGMRRITPEAELTMIARFAEDRGNRARGAAPKMVPLTGEGRSGAVFKSEEARHWYGLAYARAPGNAPRVTLRSVEFARHYNPGDYVKLVSPTPMLMVVAERDIITPTDLALQAYENALPPKQLMLVPGAGHFDPYLGDFESVVSEEIDWYRRCLAAR